MVYRYVSKMGNRTVNIKLKVGPEGSKSIKIMSNQKNIKVIKLF